MKIKLTIPGEPMGKARARTFYHNQANRMVSMTPVKTADYERYVKQMYAIHTFPLLQGQIRLTVRAYFGIPKSISKVQRQAMLEGVMRPVKRPDTDNIGKIIADSLNRLAYRDDSQIVDLVIEKYYSEDPRVDIELEEVVACR